MQVLRCLNLQHHLEMLLGLLDVVGARPGEVEEMILRRQEEESNWDEKEREEGRWPATFCPEN